MKKLSLLSALAALLLLAGCGAFFIPNTTSNTPTANSSGDYVYVANQTTNTLSGFVVGAGALTPTTGSPYTLTTGLAPASVAVSRPNTFVYVGGTGAITSYSIGTAGALTLVSSIAASLSARFISLETSPDGQWLIALDSLTFTVYTFGINTSTGALTLNQSLPYIGGGPGAVLPTRIRISPNAAYVIAALGTGGDALFTFSTSTGILTQTATLAVAAGVSDNAVTFDANSAYIYFARGNSAAGTSGVSSYSVATGGALTQVQALAASGNAPYSVLLDLTGAYLYTANRADGTLSGYSVSSGNLAALAGSPFLSGSTATALARDNSGKYLIAAAYGGSSDLTLYGFDALTPGKLNALAVYSSGTDPAGAIALATTHTSAGL